MYLGIVADEFENWNTALHSEVTILPKQFEMEVHILRIENRIYSLLYWDISDTHLTYKQVYKVQLKQTYLESCFGRMVSIVCPAWMYTPFKMTEIWILLYTTANIIGC